MGQVIVLTGASRGIGVAIARGLARPEVTLVLCARDPAGLEKTVKQRKDAETG